MDNYDDFRALWDRIGAEAEAAEVTGLPVTITTAGGAVSATLTRDHAAVSYGQPVMVLADGQALALAEIEAMGALAICWGGSVGWRLPACGGYGGLAHEAIVALLRDYGLMRRRIRTEEECDGGGLCHWVDVSTCCDAPA